MQLNGKDIEEIVKYPFLGKDWFVRIGLQGALILFLCCFLVGIPFLLGFMVTHIRRGIDGSNDYPDFNEWGLYWKRGWKTLAVQLLYALPAVIVMCGYVVILLFVLLLSAANDALMGVAIPLMMFGFVLYPLNFVYSLFLNAAQHAYLPLVALDQPLGKAFQLKKYVWPFIRANVGDILILFLVSYAAALLANAGFIFLFIGIFFTIPFAIVIGAYGTGVLYRKSTIKLPQ